MSPPLLDIQEKDGSLSSSDEEHRAGDAVLAMPRVELEPIVSTPTSELDASNRIELGGKSNPEKSGCDQLITELKVQQRLRICIS